MLLTDRVRPKSLGEFGQSNQSELIEKLKNLARSHATPHLVLHGAAGSGKKTLATAYLAEKFGPAVHNIERHTIELSYPNKQIELNVVQSLYHYVINPSLHGIYDRLIVQDFIKNLVKFRTVNQVQVPYRTVIIEQADLLTGDAQQSLRRTLERYVDSFRCIFIVRQLGALIPALQSRCIVLRVSSPNRETLEKILSQDCPSTEIIKSIAKQSRGDITFALNTLERALLADKSKIKLSELYDEEIEISDILKALFQSNDVAVIEQIRERLYNLLIHGLTAEEILYRIFLAVIKQIPDTSASFQQLIIKITADHEHNLRDGGKEIFHLESYIVELLFVIKKWALTQKVSVAARPVVKAPIRRTK